MLLTPRWREVAIKKENNRIKINAPEWVVSDYASESDIVERFVTLTSIIIQQPEVILCQ